MKTRLLPIATLLAAAAALAPGAPLTATTAVHTKPDTASPAISYLKAGANPVPAPGSVASTPAGWMAIELPGPFEGYVENKDLAKSLDVKPGAPIRLAPQADAGVLAIAEKGDTTTITGIHGKWTQISLERKLVGYIHLGGTAGYLPPIATTPAAGDAITFDGSTIRVPGPAFSIDRGESVNFVGSLLRREPANSAPSPAA
jgi:hypothetical protein